MRIGVLGSGMVGRQLAADLVRQGHEVMIGTRDTTKLAEFHGEHPDVGLGSNAEAATFGEMVLLATGWGGTEHALQLAGHQNLAGKIVVDITNPLDVSTGAPALALGWNTSAGELVQSWIPEARVVKALNIVTAAAMLKPAEFIGAEADMFIAGNDAEAKRAVGEWLEGVGWGIVDLGDITASRMLESLAMIWITIGARSGWTKMNHAFKLVNR